MKKFNWMPILKTGTFTAKNGKKVTFDEAALDKVVAATDLTKEPQFVVEHPSYDKLGFGTIEKLQRVGNYLFALPKKVEDKFKDAVNSGELPGRSVSLDENTFALSSIGFLPKEIAPAVDGLGIYAFSALTPALSQRERENTILLPINFEGTQSHFAEIEADKIEFSMEVSRWPFQNIKTMFRNMKNHLIEKEGKDKADQILSEYDIEETGNPPSIFNSPNADQNISQTIFSQNTNEDKMKIDLSKFDFSKIDPQLKAALFALQGENEALTTDLTKTKTELQTASNTISASQLAADRKEVLEFCTSDEMKVKILPADLEKTVQFLIAQKAKGKIEFSVQDDTTKAVTKVEVNAYEFAKDQLKQLPNKIELSEVANNKTAAVDNMSDAQKVGKEMAEMVNPKK